jgi:crotonobetainyl-CoA:carnitine CoA-transferase CaiB-like acyl-CoA transferase
MMTMTLADHGADVIKVEPPGGDPLRSYPGSVVWNRGKRSIVLDLHEPGDRDQFLDLIATADVLVESFSPGTMAAWGLDYDSLRDSLPALVYCSITGYPRGTAAADRPGYDLLVQARSGQQYEQPGWRDGPIFLYIPLPSVAASYLALEGIAAALYVREASGRGQWVETSLYQGVLAFTTQLWQDVEHPGPGWWVIPRTLQSSIVQCVDGLWIHSIGMAVPALHAPGTRDEDRNAFWRILDIEPVERTLDPAEAAEQEEVMRAAISKKPRDELLEAFYGIGIPIAPVRQAHEALDDPELVGNGMVIDVDDQVHGSTRQVGALFRLRDLPTVIRTGQPLVGQHSDEVLAEVASLEPRARHSRGPRREVRHALGGIKVLDMGGFLAGPFGPMMLADLGATVYKLEAPSGDQMRFATMPFNGCQRGKIDVCADLKTPEGREIAHRLIKDVDIVHHNMRPGVAERLEVDYETAKKLNPEVIYCHTTMWGRDGLRASWPGFDQLGQASCGCEYELGGEGNAPVWYRFGMCDQGCAFQSVAAVLFALYWREKTGHGQFVDTSIVEAGLYFNSDVWIGEAGPVVRPRLDPDQTGLGPLYRLYRTSDGWIAIACVRDDQWRLLTDAIGRPDLTEDVRFATDEARVRNRADLAEELAQVFGGKTAQVWFDALDAAGVPVEIADRDAPAAWLRDPDLFKHGLVAQYNHAEYGTMRQFGHLVNFSETPGRISGPPPLLGEHTKQVLAELNYSDDEIADLGERGITTWP